VLLLKCGRGNRVSQNGWKCVKCGSNDFRKKRLKLRGDMGSTGFLDAEEVTAYFCKTCGYIEFYVNKK